MSALPWLQATALSGRAAEAPRVADFAAIAATVVVIALISAWREATLPGHGPLSRRGGRS